MARWVAVRWRGVRAARARVEVKGWRSKPDASVTWIAFRKASFPRDGANARQPSS